MVPWDLVPAKSLALLLNPHGRLKRPTGSASRPAGHDTPRHKQSTLPSAPSSPKRAGRGECFSTGDGATGGDYDGRNTSRRASTTAKPAPWSRPRPWAAAARTWRPHARLPCSFRLEMSCSCFSSSELFILAGGAGNKRKGGRGEGYSGGRGKKKQDAGGLRLHYPEVGFAPAPPPPGAERAGEIIPTHLLSGLGCFTCRQAEGRGQAGSPGAGDGDVGGTHGGTWARNPCLACGRRCPSPSSAEAGAAGCAGGRRGGLREFAVAISCTLFSLSTPPRTPGRAFRRKPALGLQRLREPHLERCQEPLPTSEM